VSISPSIISYALLSFPFFPYFFFIFEKLRAVTLKPAKSFEFPDGFNTSIGAERFKIPEIMFNPQKYIRDNGSISTTTATTPSTTSETNPEFQPVQYLIQNSITSCDVDMRTSLYSNIVLTGGNTLFSGFADRLNYEMGVLAPGVSLPFPLTLSFSYSLFY